METVNFTFHDTPLFVFEELLLTSFLPTIFIEEKVVWAEVDYIFCSDDYLLGMNKEYLDHDTYTDILTFTLSDNLMPIVSEIYISIDRVKENAQLYSVEFLRELNRVIIHGVLHLCGFSDHTTILKRLMTEKEDYYLKKLGST